MDFATHIGLLIDLSGFLLAIFTLWLTSRSERKATEDQTRKERVRATLTEFGALRNNHQGFNRRILELNKHDAPLPEKLQAERRELIRDYLSDLERFSVGCNMGAYDLDVVNRMSGGQLVGHYKRYFRDFITERRLSYRLSGGVSDVNKLYDEFESMIHQLCDLRGEPWIAPEHVSEEHHVLHFFLTLPISSTERVFARFRTLPGAVETHGEGKQGYLYVPGTRADRCVLVAHADTYYDRAYQDAECAARLERGNGVYYSGSDACSIGADDRAGCAMLWLLRNSGHSLLLLDGEEHGQIGSHYLRDTNPSLFDELNSHSFMVQLDRRGKNDYKVYDIPVSDEFLAFVERETGYERAEGSGKTDIMVLCRDVCGVNLSVGYYDEHRGEERLVISEWERTLGVVRSLLEKDLKRYPTHGKQVPEG